MGDHRAGDLLPGGVPAAVSQFASPAAAPPAGGTGLRGTYYNNEDFTGPRVERVDKRVEFDWGTGSPAGRIKGDTFSVRWVGEVQAVEGGVYTFRTYSDDGARLWVNGQLVIDHWGPHTPANATGTVVLAPGRKYDIRLDYRDVTGGAVVRLEWERPGQDGFVVVPTGALFPPAFWLARSAPDWWAAPAPSRQQLLHHVPVHVGQAEVAALEAVRQLRVVEAEQVQDAWRAGRGRGPGPRRR